MVEFESQLGKKKFPSSPQRKMLTVDDAEASQPMPSYPQPVEKLGPSHRRDVQPQQNYQLESNGLSMSDMDNKRQEAIALRNKISPEGKRRIEILAELGRMTGEVEVEGVTFSFRSLRTKEQKDVFSDALGHPSSTGIGTQYLIMAHTLARAITHVDNQPLEFIVGSASPELKVVLFEEMDDTIVDYLYRWYKDNIVAKAKAKYSIDQDNDAEEVAADIKK